MNLGELMENAPGDVWRVLSELRYKKDRGEKQITVDVADLFALIDHLDFDQIERLECEVTRLEDKLYDQDSEIERLYEDVSDAQEERDNALKLIEELKVPAQALVRKLKELGDPLNK